MKRLILLSFFTLATSIFITAQTEEGGWMVSGILDTDLSLDDSDDATMFLFKPGVGKFVRNRLAFGGNLGYIFTKNGDNKNTIITIGPFVRWYILGQETLQMYLHGEMNYLFQKNTIDNLNLASDESDNGFGLFLAPGLSYFLSDNVSIDVQLGYNYRTFGNDATSENIRLQVGFQIFL